MTLAQRARLARLPASARVVGVDRACPIVRQPDGRLARVEQDGRLVAATILANRKLELRRRRRGVAKTKSYRDVWF